MEDKYFAVTSGLNERFECWETETKFIFRIVESPILFRGDITDPVPLAEIKFDKSNRGYEFLKRFISQVNERLNGGSNQLVEIPLLIDETIINTNGRI